MKVSTDDSHLSNNHRPSTRPIFPPQFPKLQTSLSTDRRSDGPGRSAGILLPSTRLRLSFTHHKPVRCSARPTRPTARPRCWRPCTSCHQHRRSTRATHLPRKDSRRCLFRTRVSAPSSPSTRLKFRPSNRPPCTSPHHQSRPEPWAGTLTLLPVPLTTTP